MHGKGIFAPLKRQCAQSGWKNSFVGMPCTSSPADFRSSPLIFSRQKMAFSDAWPCKTPPRFTEFLPSSFWQQGGCCRRNPLILVLQEGEKKCLIFLSLSYLSKAVPVKEAYCNESSREGGLGACISHVFQTKSNKLLIVLRPEGLF